MKTRTYADYFRVYWKCLQRGHLYFAELMHAYAHQAALEAMINDQPATKVA